MKNVDVAITKAIYIYEGKKRKKRKYMTRMKDDLMIKVNQNTSVQ